jgi:hypothetical protein
LDWGLSQLNLNNQFTASVTYDLPFGKGKKFGSNWSAPVDAAFGGWEADIIEKATSGFPLFVVDTNNGNFAGSDVNFSWNGNSLNRPDQVGAPAAAGELGDANRAPMYGPRFVNTDLSLIKHFRIREGILLDFRSEFFNLFNHAQFFLPGGGSGMQDISSQSSFGKITQTVNNPRLVQFALKLKF